MDEVKVSHPDVEVPGVVSRRALPMWEALGWSEDVGDDAPQDLPVHRPGTEVPLDPAERVGSTRDAATVSSTGESSVSTPGAPEASTVGGPTEAVVVDGQ